jgi:hypothetical protein
MHEEGGGSWSVMAERRHAMGENLFCRPGSNHVQQGPPRKRRFITYSSISLSLSLSLSLSIWSFRHMPVDQLAAGAGPIGQGRKQERRKRGEEEISRRIKKQHMAGTPGCK